MGGIALHRRRTSPEFVEAQVALAQLISHAIAMGCADWDPFDGLASPALRKLARTAGGRQLALQLVKRSPHFVRRTLRVPRLIHPKSLALFATAACKSEVASHRDFARSAGLQLLRSAHVEDGMLAWSYGFDVQTRWGYYSARTPNAVAQAFAIHALLDLGDAFPEAEFNQAAGSAAEYAHERLWAGSHFAYYPGNNRLIYNANSIVAGALARAGRSHHATRARDAIAATISAQRHDGSWLYGDSLNLGWVDGFHTAYVLDGLRFFHDQSATDALERGLNYYRRRLIDADGAPRATVESRYPIESHAAGAAIATFARLAQHGLGTFDDAARVLRYSLAHLRRPDGRYVYRLRRHGVESTSFIRWNDAPMAAGLSIFCDAAAG